MKPFLNNKILNITILLISFISASANLLDNMPSMEYASWKSLE